jgi:SAM-dependent methyltransferase
MKYYKARSRIKWKDVIFFPLRLFLRHDIVSSLGLTSLLEERMDICAKYAQIPLLDIGCGEENPFTKRLGKGYGLDILPLKNVDICADARYLPFKNQTFQTVFFIGSFNYMKDADRVLEEARRVLRLEGRLLITITAGFWSRFRHATAWWNKPHNWITRGMRYGYSEKELNRILNGHGFEVLAREGYFLGISKIFIAAPKPNR